MAFATVDEVAVRLGKASEDDLTAAQVAQATLLIELATGIIAESLGRDDGWATDLDPVPTIVRAVVLEAVARVMQNPGGARSESETLGAHSHSVSYTDNAHGLTLFDTELSLVRRVLLGSASGSAYVPSVVTELAVGGRELPVGDVEAPLYDWMP